MKKSQLIGMCVIGTAIAVRVMANPGSNETQFCDLNRYGVDQSVQAKFCHPDRLNAANAGAAARQLLADAIMPGLDAEGAANRIEGALKQASQLIDAVERPSGHKVQLEFLTSRLGMPETVASHLTSDQKAALLLGDVLSEAKESQARIQLPRELEPHRKRSDDRNNPVRGITPDSRGG